VWLALMRVAMLCSRTEFKAGEEHHPVLKRFVLLISHSVTCIMVDSVMTWCNGQQVVFRFSGSADRMALLELFILIDR